MQITATAGGITGSTQFRVALLEAPFTAVRIGWSFAHALNDRGDVVRLADTATVQRWSGGQTTAYQVPALSNACCNASTVISRLTDEGVMLIHRRFPGPYAPIPDDIGWTLQGAALTGLPGAGHDMNDHGQVAGTVRVGTFEYAAYLWEGGQMVRLHGVSELAASTSAVALNNRGQVLVNRSRPVCTPNHWFDCPWGIYARAYVWEDGHYTPIPRPHPACSEWRALDINDAGHVLVRCIAGTDGAFVWDGTGFTDLGMLKSASELNDRGEVVAWEADGPYLWRNGKASRLIDQPRTSATSLRINNRGQILLNMPGGAYLLTPLP